jgi:hypothetical protein
VLVSFDLAENGRGDAAAVWQEGEGEISHVRAAVRPAGRGWQPASAISSPGPAERPRVGIDAAGDTLAVWDTPVWAAGVLESVRVQASERPAGGGWQPPAVLSRGTTDSHPELAVSPSGAASVVWQEEVPHAREQPGRAYAYAGAPVVQATVRPRASAAWSPPATLAEEPGTFSAEPMTAITPRGEAIVVWQDDHIESNQVLVATRSRDGRWAPARLVHAWRHITAPLEPTCSRGACERARAIPLPGAQPQILATAHAILVAWREAYAGRGSVAAAALEPRTLRVLGERNVSGHAADGPRLAAFGGWALLAWSRTGEAPTEQEVPEAIELAERPG